MYSLTGKVNRLELPIDMHIGLFNKSVNCIILFGAEIWGYGNLNVIERIQLPNNMVYGETGCYPLQIDIEERIIFFGLAFIHLKMPKQVNSR